MNNTDASADLYGHPLNNAGSVIANSQQTSHATIRVVTNPATRGSADHRKIGIPVKNNSSASCRRNGNIFNKMSTCHRI